MCERNHFHHVKPNSSSLQWPFSISNHNDRSLQCDKCLHWRQSPPAPPHVVCWDDEVRTDPRAWLISSCQHGCVFVARLYGFVHGLNLWNSCASCPEWELCMSNCHLANPPHTHPLSAPAPLPFCSHYTSCGHKDITAPGRVKLKVPFLPIFRTLPFIAYWRWALRSSPPNVCYFYLQKWNSGRITDTRVFW